MKKFTPKLQILLEAQRRLWNELDQVPKEFNLMAAQQSHCSSDTDNRSISISSQIAPSIRRSCNRACLSLRMLKSGSAKRTH
jgi:hypothetical protein